MSIPARSTHSRSAAGICRSTESSPSFDVSSGRSTHARQRGELAVLGKVGGALADGAAVMVRKTRADGSRTSSAANSGCITSSILATTTGATWSRLPARRTCSATSRRTSSAWMRSRKNSRSIALSHRRRYRKDDEGHGSQRQIQGTATPDHLVDGLIALEQRVDKHEDGECRYQALHESSGQRVLDPLPNDETEVEQPMAKDRVRDRQRRGK